MAPEHRSDPQGAAEPDPTRIQNPAEFAAALARLKGDRSYRTLTAVTGDLTPVAARRASAVDDWTPEVLTRGTVSDWLSGRGMPTRAKLLTFLTVSEVPPSQIPGWLAALERIKNGRSVADSGPVLPDRPRLIRRPMFAPIAVIVVIAIVIGAVLLAREVQGTVSSPRAAEPAAASGPLAGCSVRDTGPTHVLPRVTADGGQLGMFFCPVVINGGRLPITGPFDLSGQVLGPIGERQQVVLINYGDPTTCDALGNRPPRGGFLISQVVVGSSDGQWSYVDKLGYDEAVTIARQYEYVTASQDSLIELKGDAARWIAAHPQNPDDYPGILARPADARTLATFDVPAGEFTGAKPCK